MKEKQLEIAVKGFLKETLRWIKKHECALSCTPSRGMELCFVDRGDRFPVIFKKNKKIVKEFEDIVEKYNVSIEVVSEKFSFWKVPSVCKISISDFHVFTIERGIRLNQKNLIVRTQELVDSGFFDKTELSVALRPKKMRKRVVSNYITSPEERGMWLEGEQYFEEDMF